MKSMFIAMESPAELVKSMFIAMESPAELVKSMFIAMESPAELVKSHSDSSRTSEVSYLETTLHS